MIVPQTFLAVEVVNYNDPGDGYNRQLIEYLPNLPADYAELGVGGVWGWNMAGHHYDASKPATEFNRTMLPTSPEAVIPHQVLQFYWKAREINLLTGWHEGDVSQVVYGAIPNEKRVWMARQHYAQVQRRIAVIAKHGPHYTSLDNCGNLAGMRDQQDGHTFKQTFDLNDPTYTSPSPTTLPRQPEIVTDVVQMFIGGLPHSRIVIEPSYRPVECWWEWRLPDGLPAMQQVDIDLKRTHEPAKGYVSPDEFLILASTPPGWNLQIMRRFIGECHAQGSHAIIKKHHFDAALRADGRTVPGGG